MATQPTTGILNRMLLRKTVEQVQRETQTSQLKRTLGPWNLVFLGIGCIIGAGIFVRTGNAAALHAGPAVLISFLIAGFVCALAGLCYAELSSTLPVSGSAYTYSYTTIGEFAAWIMGALLLLEYGLAASVVAVGWAGYVVSLLGDFGLVIPVELTGPTGHVVKHAVGGELVPVMVNGAPLTYLFNLPAFLICGAMTALLIVGVSESAKVNNVIVAIKLTVIIAFIVICGAFVIAHFDTLKSNWQPFIPPASGDKGEFGWGGILRAASIVFFAYIGFDAVSNCAQEARKPQRDMPIGILGSLAISTVLYIAVASVLTGLVPYPKLNVADPVVEGARTIGMPWLSLLIEVGALVGLTTVILVLLYGQSRIFATIANDGLLPPVFARIHPRLGTPWISQLVIGIGVAIVAAMTPIDALSRLVGAGTLFAFVLVCIAVIYLRRAEPHVPRPFRTPYVPWLPLAGILACLGLLAGLGLYTWIRLGIWIAIGLVIYFVYGRFQSRLRTR